MTKHTDSDVRETPARPLITPADRLGLTLCLAILAHAIIILGVTFSPEELPPPRFETMEVILVQQQSPTPPDEATVLAQVDLQGGGDSDEQPSNPVAAPFPAPAPTEVAPPQQPPPVEPSSPPDEVVEEETELLDVTEQMAVESSHLNEKLALKQEAETDEKPVAEDIAEQTSEVEQETPKRELPPERPMPPTPSATALIANSLAMAALSAELQRKLKKKAERPRRKYISANTKAYKYAAYMEAWRTKVERIGNLNYPNEARKRKLFGNLILDVEIAKDGSINSMTVRRSSGHEILDAAAKRIVRLGAPYAPFPENIREETDILHITRTWRFSSRNQFQ